VFQIGNIIYIYIYNMYKPLFVCVIYVHVSMCFLFPPRTYRRTPTDMKFISYSYQYVRQPRLLKLYASTETVIFYLIPILIPNLFFNYTSMRYFLYLIAVPSLMF
jgi:hypothetical protein